jgi:hypothetical protein
MPVLDSAVITLRCLGTIEGSRFLDGRTADGTVGLAPTTDQTRFSGTRWQVRKSDDVITLRCMGDIGPPFGGPRFLDGRTADGTVGLAAETTGVFTGTRWDIQEVEPNVVTLKCLGAIEGPKFLDGRTAEGTVGLAPATTGGFTGTRWQLTVVQTPIH